MSKSSKRKKGKSQAPKEQKGKQLPPFLTKNSALILYIGLLFLLLIVFFHQAVFQGKIFVPPDYVASRCFDTYREEAMREGVFPLWTPYIFSGMPSFGSLTVGGSISFDWVHKLWLVAQKLLFHIILRLPDLFWCGIRGYLFFGLFTYLFLRHKGFGDFAAFFSAVSAIFSTHVIAWVMFNHNTKTLSLMWLPLMLWLVEKVLERRKLLYLVLLGMVCSFQFMPSHYQIIYYTYLAAGIYFISIAIAKIRAERRYGDSARAAAFIAVAIVLGMALMAWLNVSVYEYSKYSIRGGTGPSGGGTSGLSYEYATSWSFHPAEMIELIVPSFFGFGGQTYWGYMPFTDFPIYVGLVPLVLAGIAVFYGRKEKANRVRELFWFAAILALISLLISFGRHFPVLYGPMFRWLPFFDKFRVPNMILCLFSFSTAILAGLGLKTLLGMQQTEGKSLMRFAVRGMIALGGLFVLMVVAQSWMEDIYSGLIAHSGRNIPARDYGEIFNTAWRDALRGVAILFVTLGGILLLLKGKLSVKLFQWGLLTVLVVDLWTIDYKPMQYTEQVAAINIFEKPDYVRFLEKDRSKFRILPLRAPSSNWYAYFRLESVDGYHPAKLRIYQDMLDHVGIGHLLLLNMLNVKYILSPKPIQENPKLKLVFDGTQKVYLNQSYLPRAFFVDSYELVEDGKVILEKLKAGAFDPRKVAYLEERPEGEIIPASGSEVKVTDYGIHHVTMDVEAVGNHLLVLSEIYYPAGWRAFVDEVPTRIYKTNYALRSVVVPAGVHTVRFEFAPKSFKVGVAVTAGAHILTLGVLMVYLAGYLRRRCFRTASGGR